MTSTPVTLAGRYRLERVVGRGGMAEVWAAHDELLGRRVAVKRFRTDAPGDGGGAAAVEQRVAGEMRTLAALSHPGLVTVFDAGVDDGRVFLVMEFVEGGTLTERFAGGPVAADVMAVVARQLADALDHAHGRGVVHRDVKPDNVLVPRWDPPAGPRTELADFGIARAFGDPRVTQVGFTVGTAAYLSPEQAAGVDVGPASDVYSLALVLLEGLTGHPAWTGSVLEVAAARLSAAPDVPADLPAGWAPLLRAMTVRDPAARPTAAQVRDRVPTGATTVLAAPTRVLPNAAPGRTGAVAPGRSRRRFAVAGASILVAAVVATVVAVAVGAGDDGGAAPAGTSSNAPASPGAASSPAAATSADTVPVTPVPVATPTAEPTAADPTAPAGPGNGNGNSGAPGQTKEKKPK